MTKIRCNRKQWQCHVTCYFEMGSDSRKENRGEQLGGSSPDPVLTGGRSWAQGLGAAPTQALQAPTRRALSAQPGWWLLWLQAAPPRAHGRRV